VWIVQLTTVAAAELGALAEDQRAHFMRIRALIQDNGLARVHQPHVGHLEGPLWEMRMKGKDGIARALYVTRQPERVVVVRVFVKKTQKTPRREIELALKRAQEIA
jgi:phage-related protein